MTIVKSLKVGDKGYHHRVHRSKKGRRYIWPKDMTAKQRKRAKLDALKEREVKKQLKRFK